MNYQWCISSLIVLTLWTFPSCQKDQPLSGDQQKVELQKRRIEIFRSVFSDYREGKKNSYIEDSDEREKLPLEKVIPAISLDQMTPSKSFFEQANSDWKRSRGSDGANRFSSLKQINRKNVKRLKHAWTYRSGDELGGRSAVGWVRNVQASPLAVNGLVYSPTIDQYLVALDARSGKEKWRYKPPVPVELARRGLMWWDGEKHELKPRLYFSSADKLVALDAATGKPIQKFGKNGVLQAGSSRIAPMIVGRTLVTVTLRGSSMVLAFDAYTGAALWQTNLKEEIPKEELEKLIYPLDYAGGSSWSGMAADSEKGLIFISAGNPGPQGFGGTRPGPNRHSNSLLAIDVKSGKITWSFQEIGHDLWDLDIAAAPLLTKVVRNGKYYDVVVGQSKIGNLTLLDRTQGKPLFDYHLKRAPVSKVPFEKTHPYQPELKLPQPLSELVFHPENLTSASKESRKYVEEKVKGGVSGFFRPPELGRKLIVNNLNGGISWGGGAADNQGRYFVPTGNLPWIIHMFFLPHDESDFRNLKGGNHYQESCSSCHGSNREGFYENWGTGDFKPSLTGYSFIEKENEFLKKYRGYSKHPSVDLKKLESIYGYFLELDKKLLERDGPLKMTGVETTLKDQDGHPGSKPTWGALNSVDLNTGKILWKVPLGYYPKLKEKGIDNTGSLSYGGTTVTAGGLVFVSGTPDKMIRAFDTETGKELWKHRLPFSGSAAPIIYSFKGKQYIVIQSTGMGFRTEYGPVGDAIVAFVLP